MNTTVLIVILFTGVVLPRGQPTHFPAAYPFSHINKQLPIGILLFSHFFCPPPRMRSQIQAHFIAETSDLGAKAGSLSLGHVVLRVTFEAGKREKSEVKATDSENKPSAKDAKIQETRKEAQGT